jgi:DNA adenine methylase
MSQSWPSISQEIGVVNLNNLNRIRFTPKGRNEVVLDAFEEDSLSVKKSALLRYLQSPGEGKKSRFKRLSLSPIRYAGGKSLAVGYVVEHLPDDVKKVVSPFFGGGSVEIAMSKILGLEVQGYDIFDILVNYWQHQLESPAELYSELQKLRPDKSQFEEIRLLLNEVWRNGLELSPLELATKYVYNFNLSYGPGFMGWASDIYLNEASYSKMTTYIRNFDPGNLKVGVGSFQDTLVKHREDFLYLDPPYLLGQDSKMFKGIYPMRNIPVHHNGFDHELLANLLRQHKGGFVLSYNDCGAIRELYSGFDYTLPSWQYSMGQGETRIGTNRLSDNSGHIKDSHEILIIGPRTI